MGKTKWLDLLFRVVLLMAVAVFVGVTANIIELTNLMFLDIDHGFPIDQWKIHKAFKQATTLQILLFGLVCILFGLTQRR